ncbi:MAG: hypothetical protein HN885_08535, partial [Nitrospina sp.]|nr:hypothetical protein [Nitrospina sp.]
PVTASRLLLSAFKAGSAAGLPSSPNFCTAILILERLLLPKSFNNDSNSFASEIDIEDIKKATTKINPIGRIKNFKVLETLIEQKYFIGEN